MADIEKLVRHQTRIVFAMAVTFALWQGSDIVMQSVATDSFVFVYAGLAKVVGAIAYVISALFLFLFYRRVKRANAAIILRDDWNRLTRGLAIQYGFFFLIGAIALFYAISMFWTLPVLIILQSLLIVGVTGTLMAFVMLQGKAGYVV